MLRIASKISFGFLLLVLAGCGSDEGAAAVDASSGAASSDARARGDGGSSSGSAGGPTDEDTPDVDEGVAGGGGSLLPDDGDPAKENPADGGAAADADAMTDAASADAGPCPPGLAGSACEDCADGFQDEDGDGVCLPGCDATGADAIDCGVEGTCVLTDAALGTRTCECDDKYLGDLCESCAVGYERMRSFCELNPPPGDDLHLWLDADSAPSVSLGASNVVTAWADRRTNVTLELTQGTPSARPGLVANARNGRSAIRFDGGDQLARAGFSGLSGSDYEIIVAAQPLGDGTPNGLVSLASGTTDWAVMLDQHQGSDYRVTHRQPAGDSGGVVAVANRSEALRPGWVAASHMSSTSVDTLTIYASDDDTDATAVVNINPSAAIGSSLTFRVGRTELGFLLGDVYEVLIYTRRLTVDERKEVTDYLTAKWNL